MVQLGDVVDCTDADGADRHDLHRRPSKIAEAAGGACVTRESDLVKWYVSLLADRALFGPDWFQVPDSGFSRFDAVWLRRAGEGAPLVLEAKGVLAPRHVHGPKGSGWVKLQEELKSWGSAKEALSRAASRHSGGRRPSPRGKANFPHAVAGRELARWVQQRLQCRWGHLEFSKPDVVIARTGLSKPALKAAEGLAAQPPREINRLTLLVFRFPRSQAGTKRPAGDARVYRRRFVMGAA